MKKSSAAQRAADYLDGMGRIIAPDGLPFDANELAKAVRREDRQRRQMERAILAWDRSIGEGKWLNTAGLEKIARRLRRPS